MRSKSENKFKFEFEREAVRGQTLPAARVGLQDPSGPVGNQNGLFQQIEKTRDHARRDRFVGWQLDDRTASQLALLGTLVRFVESGEFHLIHFGLLAGNQPDTVKTRPRCQW